MMRVVDLEKGQDRDVVLWEDGGEEHVCGGEDCWHTNIQHKDHTGWLVDGKVRV